MLTAKSVKVLVLASSMCLTPDQSAIIDLIIEELNLMFKKPENHLVIGITKARLTDSIIPEEEVLDFAMGQVDDQELNRSFKGYTCIRVEQDDDNLIKEMISEVFKKGCVKDHIKMGFIQSHKIEDIFERVKPTSDFDTM